MSTPSPGTDSPLLPFSPRERESFLASIARHRRGAASLGWLSNACALVLALVVAMLMAPLCYAIIGLASDVLNFVVPTPDIIAPVTDAVAGLIDAPEAIPLWRYIEVALLAAIPGVCLMLLMLLMLHTLGRLMREAMTSDASTYAARAPNPAVPDEQRFANTAAEMAIAAAIAAPPRVGDGFRSGLRGRIRRR